MLSRRRFILTTALAAGATLLRPDLRFVHGQAEPGTPPRGDTWRDRMIPVHEPAGWTEEDNYCWGGDAIVGPGEHGPETVHFFGARWPKWSGFLGWLWRSEICRATSASLTGPFTTREVLIDDRTALQEDGSPFWDHHSAFNPTVLEHAGKVNIFYTGTQHDPVKPFAPRELPQQAMRITEIRDSHERMNQRIGMMIGDGPAGPWRRMPEPLFVPEPGAPIFHSNPSAVIAPDGRCFVYYKTIDPTHRNLVFALATAPTPEGPYTQHPANPIIAPDRWSNIEDMCVWIEHGRFFMLFKDMSGRLGGVPNGTVMIESPNGIDWDLKRAKLAFTPGWPTPDGFHEAHRLERPNLLMQEGRPAVLYCAAIDGDERLDPTHPLHRRMTEEQIRSSPPLASRNIAIALRPR